MDRGDGVPPDSAPSVHSTGCLLITRVDRFETGQSLTERRRQSLVCCGLVREQGVATRLRDIQSVQESRPWRLVLIADIAVPGDRVGTVGQEVAERRVFSSTVDEVNFGISRWSATAAN